MIKNFIQYDKFDDYRNFKESECIMAAFFSVITFAFICYLDVYNQFSDFINPVSNLLLYVIAGYFGLLGFSLSGIAIITGLFSKEQMNMIKKRTNNSKIEKILLSFQFLSFNLSLGIIICIGIYLALFSKKDLPPICFFYILVIILAYFIYFNIFYTVSLVGNCITLYKIKNVYDDIIKEERTIIDVANEIKVDFALGKIACIEKRTAEDVIKELFKTIYESPIENKEEVINYLNQQLKQ